MVVEDGSRFSNSREPKVLSGFSSYQPPFRWRLRGVVRASVNEVCNNTVSKFPPTLTADLGMDSLVVSSEHIGWLLQ
jgi:hypothetical protein